MVDQDGYNFAIFSSSAVYVSLSIYKNQEDLEPYLVYILDAITHRTGDIWHIKVTGLQAPIFYHYSCDGKKSDFCGEYRFNPNNRLLDPYTQLLSSWGRWRGEPEELYKNAWYTEDFDWQDDQPLNYSLDQCVIYEAHVKGLSRLADVAHPGTYLGVVEMIPYLHELGITSLELLPVFQFDPHELTQKDLQGNTLVNYWGYSTISFFSPHREYASAMDLGAPIREFKTMVRELHKAGIEVILDVVFNHTAEGNESGPVFHFKGLDNPTYYMLYDDKRYYWNYSGCGNTVNANHTVVTNFIIDCLRFWVTQMHVDGFRFDLATAMCRDQYGNLLLSPPLFDDICQDPVLSQTKMIVEPWDAHGGYQVGNFPGPCFCEWNDQFRDRVRAYWRNDPHILSYFATCLGGSSSLYQNNGKTPLQSLNFITCHDGFTLMDLVSYNTKHNEANGIGNEGGTDHNVSWNCGVEGKTESLEIQILRYQQIKNFFLTLMISQGVPMICAGDEIGRTQDGNNNPYCQDHEISWTSYHLDEQQRALQRFVSQLIALRHSSQVFHRIDFFTGVAEPGELPDIQWFGLDGQAVNWSSVENALACLLIDNQPTREKEAWLFLTNPSDVEKDFVLPKLVDYREWRLQVNTAAQSPYDIAPLDQPYPLDDQIHYPMPCHSAILLVAQHCKLVKEI